jgi:hypothetical protein
MWYEEACCMAMGDVSQHSVHIVFGRPQMIEAIEYRLAQSAMGADEVLWRLTSMARGSLGDVGEVDEAGEFHLNLARCLEEGLGHLIKRVRRYKDGSVEVELHDAHGALRDLAKVHGLFGGRWEKFGEVFLCLWNMGW